MSKTVFFIVRVAGGYVIWECTPEDMFERTRRDPTLNKRLDRTPHETREAAEARTAELLSINPKHPENLTEEKMGPSCEIDHEAIEAFALGERPELAAHVERCSACQKKLEGVRLFIENLKRLLDRE